MLTSRPNRICLSPGCGAEGDWVPTGGYCPEHSRVKGAGAHVNVRPLEKLYRSAAWLKQFRPRFLSQNPICQHIDEFGKRCHAPAHQLHHLIEPHTTAQFYDPKNVVGLCREHHSNAPGTPHWVEGKDYVPTIWQVPSFGSGD